MAPGAAYAAGVAAGRWQDDPAQRRAAAALDRLHAQLQAAPSGWLARLRARPARVRGLYVWGQVGRGKTFLVDLFFEHLDRPDKRRVHFHRFMGEVHALMRRHAGERDPLQRAAQALAAQARVLCLDEFFVADIGDAMILAGLLEELFARGTALVTTSNSPPQALYRDGLQRARFLPAIALIERHCEVVELASDTDYRLRMLTSAPVYLSPVDEDSAAGLEAIYERLTADTVREGEPLWINDRTIPTVDYSEGVAWFAFAALCEGPRAVADYIEIARDFHTVIVQGVPRFDSTREDAARRFVHLVDELYDRNVNLILSAAAAPTALYAGERLAFEFERSASRLIEMQSQHYLARPHRP